MLVVTVPAGQTVRGEQAQLAQAFAGARSAAPRSRIVDYAATGDPRFITADGRSTYALVFTPLEKSFGAPKAPVQVQRAVAARPSGGHAGRV